MSAPKPRLRDVEARAAAATEEVERLADPRGVNDEHWRGDHLDGIRRGMAAPLTVTAEDVARAARTKRMDDIAEDSGITPDWLIEQVLTALGITVEPTP